MRTGLKKHKGSGSWRLCHSVLFKAAGQMCLVSYSACCPQQRRIPSAFVLSSPRIRSPADSVSPRTSGSASSEACEQLPAPQPHTKRGSRNRDYVFSALLARAVCVSSVNNRPFSHGLFRFSDETAEMSMRGVSHQLERGSVTPLSSRPTAIIFKGEKQPSLSRYTFFMIWDAANNDFALHKTDPLMSPSPQSTESTLLLQKGRWTGMR